MTLQCRDTQALDLLASPKATVLRLQRVLSLQYDTAMTIQSTVPISQQDFKLAEIKATKTLAFRPEFDRMATAVWWPEMPPGGDTTQNSDSRVLQGEIHLKSSLFPPSHLGHYKLMVRLLLAADISC